MQSTIYFLNNISPFKPNTNLKKIFDDEDIMVVQCCIGICMRQIFSYLTPKAGVLSKSIAGHT